jgi:hypothetical protein
MKNNQLELRNLTNQELLEINGGQIPWYTNPYVALAAAVTYLGKKAVDDWACFKDGLMGNDFNHK